MSDSASLEKLHRQQDRIQQTADKRQQTANSRHQTKDSRQTAGNTHQAAENTQQADMTTTIHGFIWRVDCGPIGRNSGGEMPAQQAAGPGIVK